MAFPATLQPFFTDMPTKMVGIAVVVAPFVQRIKQSDPEVRGWRSLALNFGITTILQLALATADPSQIAQPAFWLSILGTVLTASGVHGVGKGLGFFKTSFSLPEELRDPLKWACPHVENDAYGRPDWVCPAIPGEGCTTRSGQPCPPHVERLRQTEGGGGAPMSKGVAEAAAEAAGIAPLFSDPTSKGKGWSDPLGSGPWGPVPTDWPFRIQEVVAPDLDKKEAALVAAVHEHLDHILHPGQSAPRSLALMAENETPVVEQTEQAAEQTPEAAPANLAPTPTVALPKLSLFQRIKLKLKALAKDEPKAEQIAISTLTVMVPLAGTIVAVVAPEDVPVVAVVASQVESDLAALTVTIESSGASPSFGSVVKAIKANLVTIEAAVGLKSPKALAITNTIFTELDAIAAEL